MRVFILGLGSSLTDEVARLAQDAGLEVVGAVATRAQAAKTRRKLLAHPSNDHEHAVAEPVALTTDKTAWTRLVQRSDVVIASLVDDAKLAVDALRVFEKPRPEVADADEGDEGGAGLKRFIALSSVLTWSRNAPLAKGGEGGGGSVGHREDDFKTRKPAPAFAELKTSETQVLTARRLDELETCVVAAGLVYGGAQSAIRTVLRDAWMYPTRPLLVPSVAGGVPGGLNLLPMVSVYDLALVLARLASTAGSGGTPPPKRYMVAVDRASHATTLRDICVGVSALLGCGQVRDVADHEEADALLLDEEDGPAVTPLQLHLSFDTEADCAVDQLVERDEWQHRDGGLLAHLPFFVRDFVRAMDLRPIKTVLLGAPRAGKTVLAEQLAREYFLPLLTPRLLLRELFAAAPSPPPSPPSAPEPGQSDDAEAAVTAPPPSVVPAGSASTDDEATRLRELLSDWRGLGAAEHDSSSTEPLDIPDAALVALLRWKLRSPECRNQGYVLDGLPATLEQAKGIFERVGELSPAAADAEAGVDQDADESAGPEAGEPAAPQGEDADADADAEQTPVARTRQLLSRLKPSRVVQAPNRVIVLHAPRELLERRAQAVPESEAEASGNTQSAFERRLEQFEAESERVADFFERRAAATPEDDEAAPTGDESDQEPAEPAERLAEELEPGDEGGIEVLELHLSTEEAFRDARTFDEPVRTYMEQGGSGAPFNFHPTREELRQRAREAEAKQREDADRRHREAKEHEESEERDLRARLAADKARLALIEREEAALLEVRAKPLRAYLMDTVLPALTEGMLEVVKVQPDDPIDYLAEFLFRKGQEMETQAAATAVAADEES